MPDMINSIIEHSILRKAIKGDLVKFDLVDLRDFGLGNYKQIDDPPYGGGGGMILMAEPLFAALDQIIDNLKDANNTKIIYPSPQGQLWSHNKAMGNRNFDNLIFICGHYKDIDQRVIDKYVTNEYSIGDYVVTGGEVAAQVLVEGCIRLIPGVLGHPESVLEDSFSNDFLEYPQYTRPKVWTDTKKNKHNVPDILLSGHHEKIREWRKNKSFEITQKNRPDLLEKKFKETKK